MTPVHKEKHWIEFEQQLDALFTPDCDPYRAAAVVLFDKSLDAVTQAEREMAKRVFMRMLARRGEKEQTLRRAAEAFHRIVAAIGVERLLSREGYKMPTMMFEKFVGQKLTADEMSKVAADGFELCVRALGAMGAADVTIHECGEKELEEW